MSKFNYRSQPISRAHQVNGLADRLQSLKAVPGWQAYCRGELEIAIDQARQVTDAQPNKGQAWELLGLALRDAGRAFEATDAFERASLLSRIQPVSRICLAECYAVLKRRTLARDLYMLQADDIENDPHMLLLIASGLECIDEPHLALHVCRRASQIAPELGQVAYDMCFYSMRCGCSASLAESLAWRAVELEPDNTHFRIGLSSLLIRLGQADKALWVLRRLEASHFKEVTCRCCLERIAKLYHAAGDKAKQECCMQRLQALMAQENSRQQSDESNT